MYKPFLTLITLLVLIMGIQLLAEEPLPKDLEKVGIDEKLGEYIPLDRKFTDEDGNEVTLAKYLNGEKPAILNLVYFNCPMLCNLILTGFTTPSIL